MVVPGDLLHPDHELLEARARLKRSGLSLLPVVDGDEVVGILTHEAVQHWCRQDAAPEAEVTVVDYMSASLPICRVDESLEDVARVLDREAHPGLLVIDSQEQLAGVVTRELLEQEGFELAQSKARAGATATSHAVKSTTRARGEPHGWLKSYSVKPRVRR